MIVVEGFDNSGKTTLANKIGLPVIHPGPAPKSKKAETIYMMSQLAVANSLVVYDRITCISSMVYRNRLLQNPYIYYLKKMLKHKQFVIIYCRPPIKTITNFDEHVRKVYDTDAYVRKLMKTAEDVVHRYDFVMTHFSHLKYDYTKESPDEVIAQARRKLGV